MVESCSSVVERPRIRNRRRPSRMLSKSFDPVASGFYTASFSLSEPRAFHSATLLPNGSVLVFGGQIDESGRLEKAELIIPGEPTLVTQVDVDASIRRKHHASAQLDDGSVLFMGGFDNSGTLTNSVIRYFPETQNFVVQGGLKEPKALPGGICHLTLQLSSCLFGGQTADGAMFCRAFSLEAHPRRELNPATRAAPAGQRGCLAYIARYPSVASCESEPRPNRSFFWGSTGRRGKSLHGISGSDRRTSAGVVIDRIGSILSCCGVGCSSDLDAHPLKASRYELLPCGRNCEPKHE